MLRFNGRRIVLFIVAALASLRLGVANAQLIDHGTYFTDQTTHLDWLNNTPLAGQSYNSVLNGFGGYTTSGWRFATASEIQHLVETYVGTGSIQFGPDAYSRAFALIGMLGVNVSFGDPPDPRATLPIFSPNETEIVTQGWYNDEDSSNSAVGLLVLTAVIETSVCSTCATTQIFPNASDPDVTFIGASAILVRVPDAAALLSQLTTDVAGVGPGKSLANKVAQAQTYYSVPDVLATCTVLAGFGNEVRAQRGKKLATDLADMLTAEAQAITTLIACD